jgi:hypothetical protein
MLAAWVAVTKNAESVISRTSQPRAIIIKKKEMIEMLEELQR